jgi:hypothetical protein
MSPLRGLCTRIFCQPRVALRSTHGYSNCAAPRRPRLFSPQDYAKISDAFPFHVSCTSINFKVALAQELAIKSPIKNLFFLIKNKGGDLFNIP